MVYSLLNVVTWALASLFEPALDPLTKLIRKTNEWVGSLGEAAQENKLISQVGTGVAGAVAAGGLIYGGAHLLKGMKSGGKMLGALKGGTELAGGVAMGGAPSAQGRLPTSAMLRGVGSRSGRGGGAGGAEGCRGTEGGLTGSPWAWLGFEGRFSWEPAAVSCSSSLAS